MKTVLLAILAAIASAPGLAAAQSERPSLDHPSTTNPLSEQLAEVRARIDHRQADGRLARQDADKARLVANDIGAEIADRRLQNGGQLSERDRFALQDRIRRLVVEIDGESGEAPVPR
jgi:hypothetical protein